MMKRTAKVVLAKVLWMARGTTTMMGFAVMLAVILGVGTTALAAVPGDPFKLGKLDGMDKISILVGSSSGALLRINNDGSGPALDLRVQPGEAPMNVNSSPARPTSSPQPRRAREGTLSGSLGLFATRKTKSWAEEGVPSLKPRTI